MVGLKLSELNTGQKALIEECIGCDVCIKLLEMGILPDTIVEVEKAAPLGDPIRIKIEGHSIALRKDEAQYVIVKVI